MHPKVTRTTHEDANDINAYENDANDSEADGDNIEPNVLREIPTEASKVTGAEHTIDLLNKFHNAEDKDIDGQACVYRTTQGENVPVSDAHITTCIVIKSYGASTPMNLVVYFMSVR